MKKNFNRLLYPKNYIIIIGFFLIILSMFYLIFFNGFGKPISYVLYLLMSYSLLIICIKLYGSIKKSVNKIIDQNKYLRRYRDDYILRHKVSLIFSLMFSIVYTFFKLISGIILKSIWFITFGLYYLLLVVLRANLMKYVLEDKNNLQDEYFKYRNTAVILLFANVLITAIILIIVNQKIMNIYPEWMAIATSVYTFYLIFNSIFTLIKYRKYKSPLISSSKIINVVTSLVSLITLEIVLIPTFGDGNIAFFDIMIMSTGGIVAVIIVIISLYMIVSSTEWLHSYDNK